ncbi:MAG: hypothetical protein AB7E98_17055 [Pirellulales bacterium]
MTALLKRIWASPWTLLGLMVGGLALASGGSVRRQRGTLAFTGGAATAFLRFAPFVRGASAMALGHVILARTAAELDDAYDHELVHVRQYERWGPLFIPAYFAAALWQLLRGRHPYWDNPFEREAYREAP